MSIQVENLTHIYAPGLPHESKALQNVNFRVDKGEILGIIGHTGSGKSTLVQHLNGILKATEGRIIIEGVDITKVINLVEVRKKVGLVFQYPEYQLFEETVEKDIAFGPKNLGLEENEIRERIREALELVGMDFDTFSNQSPFNLSGGQKRRVAIAGVIAMKPKVLILDEPTAGLDPVTHQEILSMVKKIHKKQENITIFVSHNMDDIASMCDKVLVMNKGRVELFGTPKEVFSHSIRLREMGLDLPSSTQIVEELIEGGFELPKGITTLEEARDEILKVIGRKKEIE